MPTIGSQKRRRMQVVANQKRYRERKKGESEFIQQQRKRKREYDRIQKVRYQALLTDFEKEKKKNEIFALKIHKLKGRLAAAEMQLELIEKCTINIHKSTNVTSGSKEFIDKMWNSPQIVKQFFGLHQSEIQMLFDRVTKPFQDTTTRGQPRQRASKKGNTISPFHILLMTLFWLRQYPTMGLLYFLFNVHPRTAIKQLNHMIIALKTTLQYEIQWPTEIEWKSHCTRLNKWLPLFQYPEMRNCISVVDGTEFQMKRPSIEPYQTELYSVKKKQHSLNMLIIVLLDGPIIYLSCVDRGSNDQSLWNREECRRLFENKSYGVLGDGGFSFNRVFDTTTIIGQTPKKKPRKTKKQPKRDLTQNEKKKNTMISRYRVVVENTIGQVKQWSILAKKYRHFTAKKEVQRIDFGDIVFVCAALTNIRIKKKPLRKENWTSKAKCQDEIEQLTWQFQEILKLV